MQLARATAVLDSYSTEHLAGDALDALQMACRQLEQIAVSGAAGARLYHRSISIVHTICDALTRCEEAGVGDADIRAVVRAAREIHAASPFVTRLQRWPRGYPGDFETVEWLWSADNLAPADTLAHAIEGYALGSAISQQHRNKVSLQAECMLLAFRANSACRIASIGCGGSLDLRSVVGHVPREATIVLCDSDPDALTYSRAKLAPIADQCRFVQGIVPRVLRRVREQGPFDLILAGGLFDYLSDRFIARTLSDAWSMLAPGGHILFTNIAAGNPYRVWLEYMGDWKLIERTEPDIARICRSAGVATPVMTRDTTSLAIVAKLTKESRVELRG